MRSESCTRLKLWPWMWDTETLVSERSRFGDDDFEPEHESAPEEDELWERNSVASGISEVEVQGRV